MKKTTIEYYKKAVQRAVNAVESLGRMKPFGDENFDAVERDFPIKFVQEGPAVW